jgi:hypothetical protein
VVPPSNGEALLLRYHSLRAHSRKMMCRSQLCQCSAFQADAPARLAACLLGAVSDAQRANARASAGPAEW